MRKIVVLTLIAALAVFGLLLIAGCGGAEEEEETTTTPAGEDTDTTAAEDEDGETATTEAMDGEAVEPLDPRVTVDVAFDDAPGTAGIILADQMGFFDEVGIDIEYVKFASGAHMYNSLAANQVDVGRGIVTASLFNGAARGVRVWVVADSGTNVPGEDNSYFTLVVREEVADEMQDFADLEGRKVAIVSVGSINEYFLRKAAREGGLTVDDIDVTIIGEFPDMNTALGNEAVDAAVQIEPLITIGENEGILRYWKDADEYAPGEQVAALLYSDDFAQNTEVANRFMLAHVKGVRVYNDAIVQGDVNRDEVLDILTEHTFIDDPELWIDQRPTGLDPNGDVLTDSVAGQQDFYAEIGQVEETASMDDIVDLSFSEWAVSELGEYEPPQ